MWNTIAQQISEHINTTFIISEKHQLSGGDVNLAYKINDERHTFFIKINEKHYLDNFNAEAFSLEKLTATRSVKVPEVILTGSTLNNAYLVTEFLPFNEKKCNWSLLASQLAACHQSVEQEMFGWDDDNFIGHTPQPNCWKKKWCSFFAEQRIGWQLQLLEEQNIHLLDINEITSFIKNKLASHQPTPSLLHGDLWRGNLSFCDGNPVIFDPACYFGDREVDIAMTELFGRLPDEFYATYNEILPLSDGYQTRKEIYNLYHILNHALMFKGHYIQQAKAMITKILC
ncbi:fructosamine kinase family protein [Flocculibacter collagenilyticus]|uniref:fructosamine kinase family protein n=1 Tax=Flocculibacter collagenilyticus TaxID=2744479 RepID=UPI0018F42748|nr:fructosamine kinase family protein [Flocculibacter collagenilyticus]